jgi:transaldolase/glucose-6-phosphate isomerase
MSERGGWWEGGRIGRCELRLGGYAGAVEARLGRWQRDGFGERLWRKDHTLWSPEPVPELTDRLGWLELPESAPGELDRLTRFAEAVKADGYRHAIVLGMGGSSLAPEVFARTLGSAPGYPSLEVLDSTHPAAVRAMAEHLDLSRSLFLVSSKSGTTTETLSLFRYFWDLTGRALSGADVGRHFVAVTDPGTPLERLARERRFRDVFNGPEEVGGRYSAFTAFGMVPAALIGASVRVLIDRVRAMAAACAGDVPPAENPGLRLGAALGELALAGRDKVTFLTSPALESFPDWLEQLIAESTGKAGRGIVPVVGEPAAGPESYGPDRFFVGLLMGEDDGLEERLGALQGAGHPVARIRCDAGVDLGGEMFRWKVAVAAAGSVLEVNPFDQPDVQLAKELASKAMKEQGAAGPAVDDSPRASDAAVLDRALSGWLEGSAAGEYLGLHAYLPARPETGRLLHRLQGALRGRTGLATTLGYGPRFLHSTGQLHKGGPEGGRFLQLIDEPEEEVPVPETDYSFRTLIRAQADGDRGALEQRGRRVLRLQLGRDAAAGLQNLLDAAGAPEGNRR